MQFFSTAVTTLQTLVVALGAGLAVWGVVNLLEGYGSDNAAAKSQGIKHLTHLLFGCRGLTRPATRPTRRGCPPPGAGRCRPPPRPHRG